MPATPVQVLLLSGPAGAGKNTLGREIGSAADGQWERTQARAQGFRRRNAGSADVLDTTGRAVPDLARQVIERTGWASRATQAQDGPGATGTS